MQLALAPCGESPDGESSGGDPGGIQRVTFNSLSKVEPGMTMIDVTRAVGAPDGEKGNTYYTRTGAASCSRAREPPGHDEGPAGGEGRHGRTGSLKRRAGRLRRRRFPLRPQGRALAGLLVGPE